MGHIDWVVTYTRKDIDMSDSIRYPTATFGHSDPNWRKHLIDPKAIEDKALAKGLMVRTSNSGDFSIRTPDGKTVLYSCQMELEGGKMLLPGDQKLALAQLSAEIDRMEG